MALSFGRKPRTQRFSLALGSFFYAFECDFAQAGRDHTPPDAIVMITKSAAVQGDQDRCRLTSFTKTIR